MPKKRITLPANALGPVNRQGDRARLQDKVIRESQAAAAKAVGAKAPSENIRPRPASRPMSVAQAQAKMVSMKAPKSSVRPSRAGATFTPGSPADMAYAGRRAAPMASQAAKVRPKRMGGGVGGAILTAAAAGALAARDKYKARDRKVKK